MTTEIRDENNDENSPSEEDVFKFLDTLRESGATNMMGASPYVEEAFDLDRRTARPLVIKWMETFSTRHPRES